MTHLAELLRKYREDELFRRLAIGSATWNEMIAAAILKDRSGADYRMAAHNTDSIDLISETGNHIQVKTVGKLGSFAAIKPGRDKAAEVFVIATFGQEPRFFLVPMPEFKRIAKTYDYSWEISGYRIRRGDLNEFEIGVSQIV